MAGHPIELPSKQFKSKKDAIEFFKKMLHNYSDGDEINEYDDKYLFEVIQRHPEFKEKIGVGIKRFYREKSNSHPTSCFHLERYDGSTTDFSIPSCISSKEPTAEQGFYSACREAVSDKLTSEKHEIFRNGNVKCFKTGELVSIRESEYRHTTPRFRDIVRNFILENKIEVTKAMLIESEDMQYATKFSNPNMASKFIAFHSSLAKLKIFKKYVH